MGRIKTTFIKRKTKELVAMHSDKFTTDFTENKKAVDSHAKVQCKKIRNIIAGYVTRLKKMEA
jgi:small subunit ribosomal protein S17e